jgi:predicted nucleic acid-binding protein
VIVVDASTILEVLLRTQAVAAVERRIFDPDETLHAPHLIDLEVVQVLRRYATTRQVAPARCHAALDDLMDFPLNRYAHDFMLPRIWELRANLTAYDAAYVALAEALDAPLLTCDRRLAAAPGHHARIEFV